MPSVSAPRRTPSTITVVAGNNVQIGKTASLSTASKTGDAGNVTLKAAGDINVASGARIDASSATGNAGQVYFFMTTPRGTRYQQSTESARLSPTHGEPRNSSRSTVCLTGAGRDRRRRCHGISPS